MHEYDVFTIDIYQTHKHARALYVLFFCLRDIETCPKLH
jgi:hypothetical protein